MGMEDFLRQVPGGLILMTCGSGVLLVVMWSVILWRRSQRVSAQRQDAAPETSVQAAEAESGAPEPSDNPLRKIGASVRNFFFYTEEEKQAKQIAPDSELSRPPAPASAAKVPIPTARPTPATAPFPDAVEVLRVWRDVADGSLVIQVGDQHFRTLDEMRATGQSRRFVSVLRELAILARDAGPEEGRGEAPPRPPHRPDAATPAAPPPPAPAPERAAVETPAEPAPVPTAPPRTPQPSHVQAEPPSETQPPPPAARRSSVEEMEPIGSFFDNVRRAVRERGKERPAVPEVASIPEQIEAVLQYRLSLHPPLMGRNIHVREAHGGGVIIEVDGTFFEGVGDIAEPDVREFVRAAIQEWEEKQ